MAVGSHDGGDGHGGGGGAHERRVRPGPACRPISCAVASIACCACSRIPTLKQDGRAAERRAAIRAIAHEIFDFRELSQRALARHWQARTPAERDEFMRLFADLLERSYIGKIEMFSGGDRIQYTGEALDGEQATVRTRIVTKNGTEIPVDYRHASGRRPLARLRRGHRGREPRGQLPRPVQQDHPAHRPSSGSIDQLAAKKDEGSTADGSLQKRASQK